MGDVDISAEAVERLAARLDEDGRHLETATALGDAEHSAWCAYQRHTAATLRALAAKVSELERECDEADQAIRLAAILTDSACSEARADGIKEAAAACKARAHGDYPHPLKTAGLLMHEAFACERAVLALLHPTQDTPDAH